MPEKRPFPSSSSSSKQQPPSNWKKRKQERSQTARLIQTQPTPSTTTTSSSSSSNSPFPSSSLPIPNQHRPSQIELETLISSRKFQIESFKRSIRSSSRANNVRAWQLLPRHSRRRAASHNLLRLPTRLRSKGASELFSSNTLSKTRSQSRSKDPNHARLRSLVRRKRLEKRFDPSKTLRKRLETHLWHSKRFRMTQLKGKGKEARSGNSYQRYGFVLAESSHMKSFRSSWRSCWEHCTVHDASYYTFFRIVAQKSDFVEPRHTPLEKRLERVRDALDRAFEDALNRVGLDQGLDPSWREGGRVCHTVLKKKLFEGGGEGNLHPQDPAGNQPGIRSAVAPVRILWLPQLFKVCQEVGGGPRKRKMAKSNKENGKEKKNAKGADGGKGKSEGEGVDNLGLESRKSTGGEPTGEGAMELVCESTSSQAGATILPEEGDRRRGRTYRRELFLIVHPAAIKDLKSAMQAQGLDQRTESQGLEGDRGDVVQLWYEQLDNSPDPWVAAGGRPKPLAKSHRLKREENLKRVQEERRRGGTTTDRDQEEEEEEEGTELLQLDKRTQRMRSQGFNVFELVGPDSSRILGGLLKLCKRQVGFEPGAVQTPTLVPSKGKQGSSEASGEEEMRRISKEKRQVFERMRRKLGRSESEGGVRDGTVLGLEVHDPRLSFPPKMDKVEEKHGESEPKGRKEESEGQATRSKSVEAKVVSSSRLLSHGMRPPRFSKGEIDSRRAKNFLPGKRLLPSSVDDVVPIVLIKRNFYSRSVPVRRDQGGSRGRRRRGQEGSIELRNREEMDREGGWKEEGGGKRKGNLEGFTLIVPRDWSMAFFLSLVHTTSGGSSGARVIGQNQLRQQELEISSLNFGLLPPPPPPSTTTPESMTNHHHNHHHQSISYPSDWISTEAFQKLNGEESQRSREIWSRLPRGKRVEFHFARLNEREGGGGGEVGSEYWKQAETKGDQLDRTGKLRPFPFMEKGVLDWICHNGWNRFGPEGYASILDTSVGEIVEGGSVDQEKDEEEQGTKPSSRFPLPSSHPPMKIRPFLMALPPPPPQKQEEQEDGTRSEHRTLLNQLLPFLPSPPPLLLPSILLPIQLHSIRSGTFERGSSLQIPPTYQLYKAWKSNLDPESNNRQRSYPTSHPESSRRILHEFENRPQEWNQSTGIVTSGDISISKGSRGYAVGVLSLWSWIKVLEFQDRFEIEQRKTPSTKGGRRKRNRFDTKNLVLVRSGGANPTLKAATSRCVYLG
ncbi:hypothetical protein IE53DRAFT_106286 [Violaceomyces palustris]|uniref:Uncharacterized protein n=1 Tax=Violaceomyces palustris TaxID=1673888 RepID=A0ACD0NWN7_9BASI|nr:hypothetical protein IE53DRAFT_106286 [Violaceomyces palustris]